MDMSIIRKPYNIRVGMSKIEFGGFGEASIDVCVGGKEKNNQQKSLL